MANQRNRYGIRIVLLFLLLLTVYVLLAAFVLAPRGYYGSIEQPRFADPWLERTRTILGGGLLYRDVFTATPPLTNLLLIPPSVVADWLGTVNPWATGSFMIYFALFALFTALLLVYLSPNPEAGYRVAVLFLLNPLTLGSTVLRRQDESLLVFFFALALLLLIRQRHTLAAGAIGLGLLTKLTAALLIPVAILHSWNWRYLVIPPLLFLLVMAPFLVLAGSDAIFWDFGQRDTQHPFQIGGVSLGSLWNRYHADEVSVSTETLSTIFLVAAAAALVLITVVRAGVWHDLGLLLMVVLLTTPKLHTGYFSIIVLALAPLLRHHYQRAAYLFFGVTALIADFYKWPVEDFPVAFWLMVVTFSVLVPLTLDIYFRRDRNELAGPLGEPLPAKAPRGSL